MFAYFIRTDNNAISEEFELLNNPYRVGEIVDLTYVIKKGVCDKGIKDNNFNGLFKIIEIRHESSVQTITCTIHNHKTVNIFIKPYKPKKLLQILKK